ncbi:MAG: hypothetical protein HOQ24_05545 [Mycobacteriaceae bacterium]|nr:hypothetical protein [Mycobacteriaceae bacterium]
MSPTEIAELRHTVGQLKRCVGALRSQYGDVTAVRRVAIDVDRLDVDVADLEEINPQAQARRADEVIYVPDAKSDEAAWMGAQDEGLGFHSRPRTR